MNKLVLLCSVILLLNECISAQNYRKPKSALEKRQVYNAPDFVFDVVKSNPTSVGTGGSGRLCSVEQLPPLAGLGVSLVLFRIDPCAINLPHIHPRGFNLKQY